MKTGKFTRKERVKKSEDIQNLFKNGKKLNVVGAKLFFLPNHLVYNRVAVAIPKNFGNAVTRNYAKRISREVYRCIKVHLNTGYDMVFLTYSGNYSFPTRCAQFSDLCRKAGIYKE